MSEASSSLSAILGFAPGAVGGCLNCLVGHPIDLIKVRQQTANASMLRMDTCSSSTVHMLRSIAVREGIPGLYAGVTAPLLAVVPAFAVTFWSFDLASRVQLRYNNQHNESSSTSTRSQLSIAQVAIAGGFSGFPLALVVGPLERFKCLMQVDKSRYANFADCVQKVYHMEGVRGLVRGTGLTIVRDVPGNAAYFATYEFVRRKLLEGRRQEASIAVTLLAGGLAGVANWIVAIPMDVIKSRWQTAPAGTFQNMLHLTSVLLQTEGPRALFKGLSPALLRAFPANAACLLGVETVRSVLSFV